MEVTCHVCSRTFNGQISGSHLKTHNLTCQAYYELYGDFQHPDFRAKLIAAGSRANPANGAKTQVDAGKRRQKEYLLSPKICATCQSPLPYKEHKRQRYCSHSCAAKMQTGRLRKKQADNCPNCGIIPKNRNSKYCSRDCYIAFHKSGRTERIENGNWFRPDELRKYLIATRGHRCEDCSLTEWRNEPIPIQMDHIDGNAFNNELSNLRLLCFNCHGLTPTWGARNKNNGRKTRLKLKLVG